MRNYDADKMKVTKRFKFGTDLRRSLTQTPQSQADL